MPVGRCSSGIRAGDLNAAGGAVAKAKTAARQADLPEHGGKRDGHPVRLLTVIGALHRPAHSNHGTHCGHAPRQGAESSAPICVMAEAQAASLGMLSLSPMM